MAIPKEDLKQIGDLMDKRLMIFTEKVIIPAVERITNDLKTDLKKDIKKLDTRLTRVEEDISRIDRKLDNITTHHAQKLDKHEQKLNQIFA
jgi:prefoldin subunit 5